MELRIELMTGRPRRRAGPGRPMYVMTRPLPGLDSEHQSEQRDG